jgi:hypothetical protein
MGKGASIRIGRARKIVAASSSGSVQLWQEQRTRVHDIVGKRGGYHIAVLLALGGGLVTSVIAAIRVGRRWLVKQNTAPARAARAFYGTELGNLCGKAGGYLLSSMPYRPS